MKKSKVRDLIDSIYKGYAKESVSVCIFNYPLCAIGKDTSKTKIWRQREIEADHVTAWSNGGATNIDNCQMLCIMHNRAKGNK